MAAIGPNDAPSASQVRGELWRENSNVSGRLNEEPIWPLPKVTLALLPRVRPSTSIVMLVDSTGEPSREAQVLI
jgi:hypothetical protein